VELILFSYWLGEFLDVLKNMIYIYLDERFKSISNIVSDETVNAQRRPPVIREIDYSKTENTLVRSSAVTSSVEQKYRYGSREITLEEVKELKAKVGGLALLHNKNLPISSNIKRM